MIGGELLAQTISLTNTLARGDNRVIFLHVLFSRERTFTALPHELHKVIQKLPNVEQFVLYLEIVLPGFYI